MDDSISAQVLTNVLKLISASDPTAATAVGVVTDAVQKSERQWPGVVDLFITALLDDPDSESPDTHSTATILISEATPEPGLPPVDTSSDEGEHTDNEANGLALAAHNAVYAERVNPLIHTVVLVMEGYATRPPSDEKAYASVKAVVDQLKSLIREIDATLQMEDTETYRQINDPKLVEDRRRLIGACVKFSNAVRNHTLSNSAQAQHVTVAASIVSQCAAQMRR